MLMLFFQSRAIVLQPMRHIRMCSYSKTTVHVAAERTGARQGVECTCLHGERHAHGSSMEPEQHKESQALQLPVVAQCNVNWDVWWRNL
jgi:hypothetical protein